jgi:hypothetical protein
MSNAFNDNERYGDDLNNAATATNDFFENQSTGINRVWFLPIILLGGLLTTAIVFVVNHVIDLYGHNFLTFLVNHVIPIGAIMCGFLAGIGYAIAAYFVQFYPKMRFIFFIFLLQFSLFFVARYVEYTTFYHQLIQQRRLIFEQLLQNANANENEEGKIIVLDQAGDEVNGIELNRNKIDDAIKETMPSFVEFYRATIEESEWIDQNKKDKPFKMGKWGWIMEFLSAFVFALGSLFWFGILRELPYCQNCRRFMLQKLKFAFPMRAPKRKIKKNDDADLEAFRQEEIEAINYATGKITGIEDFLKTEHATNRSEVFRLLCEIRDEVAAEAKPMKGVPNTIKITYSECNSCDNFLLIVSIVLLDINNKTAFQNAEILRFTDGKFVTSNEIPTLTI